MSLKYSYSFLDEFNVGEKPGNATDVDVAGVAYVGDEIVKPNDAVDLNNNNNVSMPVLPLKSNETFSEQNVLIAPETAVTEPLEKPVSSRRHDDTTKVKTSLSDPRNRAFLHYKIDVRERQERQQEPQERQDLSEESDFKWSSSTMGRAPMTMHMERRPMPVHVHDAVNDKYSSNNETSSPRGSKELDTKEMEEIETELVNVRKRMIQAKKDQKTEGWLLSPNPYRFVLFPIQYQSIYEKFQQHKANFWTTDEIDLSQDYKDWLELKVEEQQFIEKVLAFFAASDGIVLENLAERFMQEVQLPEARAFYGTQIFAENIHSETYSMLIDFYIKNDEKKMKLLHSLKTSRAIAAKAEWAIKYINSTRSFAERLLAFAIVEGIFFSASFCSIYWLKDRGKLPGLSFSNELIARDEGLHCDFACLLYRTLKEKLPEKLVYEMVDSAVKTEDVFVDECIPDAMFGMSAPSMKAYVQVISDRLLADLGYSALYGAKNPFDFMNSIGVMGKTNFFDKRVGDYAKAGVNTKVKNASDMNSMRTIRFDAAF